MRSMRYRIVVSGALSRRYASAFDGMSLHCSEGYTAITGTVVDQAHLHGLLNLVGELGFDLVSVAPIGESPDQEQRSSAVDTGRRRTRVSP
jgi:hypothetical protein